MSEASPPRRMLRSIAAIFAGLITGIILSVGTDAVMAAMGFLPPPGHRAANGPLLVATVYRTIYGLVASYIAAWLAPDRAMLHAMLLGVIDFIVSLIGVVFTWNKGPQYGPHWYPIALVVLALPAAWVGGKIRVNQLSSREASSESAA